MRARVVFAACLLIVSMVIPCISYDDNVVGDVHLRIISARLYEIVGGRGANGGVYIGDEAVLIIDAKMDKESVDKTIEKIKQITDLPIKYLVNTHSDPDHVYGNRFFSKDIIFIAHKNCLAEFFEPDMRGNPSDWNNPELEAYLPSITYQDKMNIYMSRRKIQLLYFGVAHTKGDTVVYFPAEKAAFIGDLVFMNRPQLIHSYKGGRALGHVKVLERMLETIDATRFYSGHSDEVTREQMIEYIRKIKDMQAKVKSLIKQGKTIDEAKAQFPDDYTRLVESIYNELK
jgi:glyoxylase-like metal-dependent hydrolase (beta-lactamase superfamily II)